MSQGILVIECARKNQYGTSGSSDEDVLYTGHDDDTDGRDIFVLYAGVCRKSTETGVA